MGKVTAETITDEQIREILAGALDRGDRDFAQVAQVAIGLWHGSHPWVASNVDHTPACGVCGCRPNDEQHTGQARERCADIWNDGSYRSDDDRDEDEALILGHPTRAAARAAAINARAGKEG